jgi:hypothetical protein
MRRWADGAYTIRRFVEASHRFNLNYLIVRYEDLWDEPERELRRIFDFVRLDTDRFDFNAAKNLPVRGSSTFHGIDEQGYHWTPVEKTPDFNPVARPSHWTRSMHERFNWIAGDTLANFGYGEKQYRENRYLWAMFNRVLDLCWRLRELFLSAVKLVKGALKSMLGADRMSRCRRRVVDSIKTIFNLKGALSHKRERGLQGRNS